MKPTLKHVQSLLDRGLIRGWAEKSRTGNGKPKAGKYGNTKLVVELEDGTMQRFDSKKEYCRYKELKLLQRIGEITDLKLQVAFDLGVCEYIADFCYYDKTGRYIVEDVKSKHTRTLPVYRLKNKLMKERLGIRIKET